MHVYVHRISARAYMSIYMFLKKDWLVDLEIHDVTKIVSLY
jgi:hypothetical protein